MPTSPHTLSRQCAPIKELRTERQAWDELMKRPYIPLGIDQQGRSPDRQPDAGPQAACELGMGDAEQQIRGVEAFRWGAIAITLGWLIALGVMGYSVWRYWQ